MHTACGHHSRESWEFSDDPRDFGESLIGRHRTRRAMRRIARDYARGHTCLTPAEVAEIERAEDIECADMTAWLDTLATCPNCRADAVPIEQEPDRYRCTNCRWTFDHDDAPGS